MVNWKKERFLIITLDPVHIGTGGYRLGRVDNAIAREPGTNLPKIPGTSLNGATRSAAAYKYEKPRCAGQSGHCSNPVDCPICYTFGSSSGGENEDSGESKTFAGAISIFDAQIVLFPIWSMFGPVWVTTKELLKNHCFNVSECLDLENDSQVRITSEVQAKGNALNLGWLMLNIKENKDDFTITPPTQWKKAEINKAIDKTVIVRESIFSHIINSNLEVRTSVSINPETGAAEERALFTYEAIPRATFLSFDVVLDDYRQLDTDRQKPFPVCKTFNKEQKVDNPGCNIDKTWNGPLDVMKAGLSLIEYLGIGGMGTRGFGRIRQIGDSINSSV